MKGKRLLLLKYFVSLMLAAGILFFMAAALTTSFNKIVLTMNDGHIEKSAKDWTLFVVLSAWVGGIWAGLWLWFKGSEKKFLEVWFTKVNGPAIQPDKLSWVVDCWKSMKRPTSHSKLLLPGVFVVLVGGAFLLTKSSNTDLAGLGWNLTAEFFGAAVTVFGIDYLIKRREAARLLPVRASSYEDVRLMTHWALDLWRDAYESSVESDAPGSVESDAPASWIELLSDGSLEKIGRSLDINKPAKVHPPQPWSIYIDNVSERIHKHAERVLERHGFVLDPEVHNAVYSMVYHGGFKISQIQGIDRHDRIPRPANLGSNMPMIRAWFDAVISLHLWTVKTHKYLAKNGITNIHCPYLFRPLEIKAQPPAAFDPGVLQAQAAAFKQWQDQKSGSSAAQPSSSS